jgi:hypothetical protein
MNGKKLLDLPQALRVGVQRTTPQRLPGVQRPPVPPTAPSIARPTVPGMNPNSSRISMHSMNAPMAGRTNNLQALFPQRNAHPTSGLTTQAMHERLSLRPPPPLPARPPGLSGASHQPTIGSLATAFHKKPGSGAPPLPPKPLGLMSNASLHTIGLRPTAYGQHWNVPVAPPPPPSLSPASFSHPLPTMQTHYGGKMNAPAPTMAHLWGPAQGQHHVPAAYYGHKPSAPTQPHPYPGGPPPMQDAYGRRTSAPAPTTTNPWGTQQGQNAGWSQSPSHEQPLHNPWGQPQRPDHRHSLPSFPTQGRPTAPPLRQDYERPLLNPFAQPPRQDHRLSQPSVQAQGRPNARPPRQDYERPPSNSYQRPQRQDSGGAQSSVQLQGRPYQPQAPSYNNTYSATAPSQPHRPSQSAASSRPQYAGTASRPTLASSTSSVRPPPSRPAASQPAGGGVTEVTGDYKFDRNISDMKQTISGMYKKEPGMFSGASKEEKESIKKHNSQLANARTVLDNHMGGNRNFVLNVDGKPAGLLSMSVPPAGSKGDDGVKIHGVMALPGTKAGKMAINQAIELSKQEGRKGHVDLEFLQFSNSYAVYKHFGFMANGSQDGPTPNSMYLHPEAARKFQEKYFPESV